MNNLLYALLYSFIGQLVCFSTFILIDEIPFINKDTRELLAIIIGVIVLIVLLVLYIIYEKKILKKHNLNILPFNVFLIIFWILQSILNCFILLKLVDMGVLHYCDLEGEGYIFGPCFFNGIEYLVYPIFVGFVSILLIIWKVIVYIYSFIRGKNEKVN
ncbi:MAG: hypothetical protein IJZ36_04305 [Bacilli bacterium]|nr:hypothetical protein [Bacilli bacterium]